MKNKQNKPKYTLENLKNARKQAERMESERYLDQARMWWKYYQEVKFYLETESES